MAVMASVTRSGSLNLYALEASAARRYATAKKAAQRDDHPEEGVGVVDHDPGVGGEDGPDGHRQERQPDRLGSLHRPVEALPGTGGRSSSCHTADATRCVVLHCFETTFR